MFQKIMLEFERIILDDERRKKATALLLYIVLAVISAVMTVVNMLTGERSMMLATLIFSLLCFVDFIIALSGNLGYKISLPSFIVEILLLMLFFLMTGFPQGFAVCWIALIPPAILMLISIKPASIVVGLMMIVLIFFFWIPQGRALLLYDYNTTFMMRFPFLVLASYAIAVVLCSIQNAAFREVSDLRNNLEEKVNEQTKDLLEINAQLENAVFQMVELTADLVENRSEESGVHVKRVVMYSKVLAEAVAQAYPEYNLSAQDVEDISYASALHDIGKIKIPDNILLKPGKFTREEFEQMKKHTEYGAEMIKAFPPIIRERFGKLGYEICMYHHERADGKGYPCGLKEEEIPIAAQIVSVADVYDALVHDRCYHEAAPASKASEMILNGECGTFSDAMLACFIKSRKKFEEIG